MRPRAPGIWRGSPRSWGRSWCSSRDRGGRVRRRKRRRSPVGVGEILVRAEAEDALLRAEDRCMRASRAAGPFKVFRRRWRPWWAGAARLRAFRRRLHPCRRRRNRRSSVRSACGRGVVGRPVRGLPRGMQILLCQLAVDAPAAWSGGNGIDLVPVAAGVAPEIDAGVHRRSMRGLQAGGVGQRGERLFCLCGRRRGAGWSLGEDGNG